MNNERPAIKIIFANTYHLDLPDDPSYPFMMEVNLRSPSFMPIVHAFLYGGNERAVALGMTIDDLMDWAYKSSNLPTHPRLQHITITDRQGNIIRSKTYREEWLPAFHDKSVFERIRSDLLPTGCPLFG